MAAFKLQSTVSRRQKEKKGGLHQAGLHQAGLHQAGLHQAGPIRTTTVAAVMVTSAAYIYTSSSAAELLDVGNLLRQVIKLDIDTSSIEVQLAMQLLQDDRYSNLIDQFYFDHHVKNKEMGGYWGASMRGSFKDSLDLFAGLRNKGIPAHSWI
jgi:hypothetical protein